MSFINIEEKKECQEYSNIKKKKIQTNFQSVINKEEKDDDLFCDNEYEYNKINNTKNFSIGSKTDFKTNEEYEEDLIKVELNETSDNNLNNSNNLKLNNNTNEKMIIKKIGPKMKSGLFGYEKRNDGISIYDEGYMDSGRIYKGPYRGVNKIKQLDLSESNYEKYFYYPVKGYPGVYDVYDKSFFFDKTYFGTKETIFGYKYSELPNKNIKIIPNQINRIRILPGENSVLPIVQNSRIVLTPPIKK